MIIEWIQFENNVISNMTLEVYFHSSALRVYNYMQASAAFTVTCSLHINFDRKTKFLTHMYLDSL